MSGTNLPDPWEWQSFQLSFFLSANVDSVYKCKQATRVCQTVICTFFLQTGTLPEPLTPTCAMCNTCAGIPRCRAAVMVGELHQSRPSAQEPCFPVCVSFLNPPASLNSSSGQASCYARRGPREPSNSRIRTQIISLISVAINHTRLLLKIVLKELCKWITIFSKDFQKLNVCLPWKTLYQ